MWVMAGCAAATPGWNMHERRVPGFLDLVFVALTAEQILGLCDLEGRTGAGRSMTESAVSRGEGCMDLHSQKTGPLGGVGIVALVAVGRFNRVTVVGVLKPTVGVMTSHAGFPPGLGG